jgi:hypothetical protein
LRVWEQELVPTLTQVLPELETKLLQGLIELFVEPLLETGPGLALLVLLDTVVTSEMQLVGSFRVGIGVI